MWAPWGAGFSRLDGISRQEKSFNTQLPTKGPIEDKRDVMDMDVTVDICQVVPAVIDRHVVITMVGLDTVQMGEETPMDCDGEFAKWDIRNELQLTVCLCIMVVIWMIRIGRFLGTLRMRNMWIGITLMLRKEWN